MAVDFTSLALLAQWIGTIVLLGLMVFLTQSIRRPSLDYWAAAWCCLSIALCALTLDVQHPLPHHPFRAGYFVGGYGFGYLLLAGCRAARDGATLHWSALRWVPPAVALTLALTLGTDDLHLQFALHAAVMSVFYGGALFVLQGLRSTAPGPGLTVMRIALLLLTLESAVDVPLFLLAVIRGTGGPFAWLSSARVVELLLGTILGFGMVMVTVESLRRESEKVSRELALLARTDPLTSALNRHAYDSVRREAGSPAPVAGCVVIADLDGLKRLNERAGQAVGDAAIRQAASAIRAVIRADDHLFRWGGDEFLVVLPNLEEGETCRRLEAANALLRQPVAGEVRPGLALSYGTAAFGGPVSIDAAIALADERMYVHKQTSPRF